MMNEKNTRALFRAEKSKMPRAAMGLVLGLGIGALIGAYFGKPVVGLNVGMGVGAFLGILTDPAVPRRSRIALGVFAFGVGAVGAFMTFRP